MYNTQVVSNQTTDKLDAMYIYDYILKNTIRFLIQIFDRYISGKAQYKDVYRKTIEILQRDCIFKTNCCLRIHNAHLKLASPISG